MENEGKFRWADGTNITIKKRWFGKQPDNYGNEDCVDIRKLGLWNDSSYKVHTKLHVSRKSFKVCTENIYCKKNFLKCRTKVNLFGYFLAGIRKKLLYCSFFTSAPSNCFEQNFAQKQKSLNLGPNCFNWIF